MKKRFDRIDLRIFEIGNVKSACRTIRPKIYCLFSSEIVSEIVANVVKRIHEARPGCIFEAVQVGPAKFNIVWKGYERIEKIGPRDL